MSLVVNNNLMAANAARTLNSHYDRLSTSTQRLSSGLRINTAADDAAGLAIRELMRSDIKTLQQGMRNANDAISLIQTADGALQVVDEKLIRMKELAEQSATGTYNSTQRLIIDSEYQAMASEITRIANSTDFNGIKLLNGNLSGANHDGSSPDATGELKVHFGTGNDCSEDYYYMQIQEATAQALGVGNSMTLDNNIERAKAQVVNKMEAEFGHLKNGSVSERNAYAGIFGGDILNDAGAKIGDATGSINDMFTEMEKFSENALSDYETYKGIAANTYSSVEDLNREVDSIIKQAENEFNAEMERINTKAALGTSAGGGTQYVDTTSIADDINTAKDKFLDATNTAALKRNSAIITAEGAPKPKNIANEEDFKNLSAADREDLKSQVASSWLNTAINGSAKSARGVHSTQTTGEGTNNTASTTYGYGRGGTPVTHIGKGDQVGSAGVLTEENAANAANGTAIVGNDNGATAKTATDTAKTQIQEALKHFNEYNKDVFGAGIAGTAQRTAGYVSVAGGWDSGETPDNAMSGLITNIPNGVDEIPVGATAYGKDGAPVGVVEVQLENNGGWPTANNAGNVFDATGNQGVANKGGMFAFLQSVSGAGVTGFEEFDAMDKTLGATDTSSTRPTVGGTPQAGAMPPAANLNGHRVSGLNTDSQLTTGSLRDGLHATMTGASDASSKRLLLDGSHIKTQEAASRALAALDRAIEYKDNIRANLGATQNRLEATIANVSIQAENLQASESRISDVDVATEMTNFTKNQILTQSAVAMLGQANSLPQMAMKLIGG